MWNSLFISPHLYQPITFLFFSLKEEEGRGGRAGEDTTAVSHREVTVAMLDVGLKE